MRFKSLLLRHGVLLAAIFPTSRQHTTPVDDESPSLRGLADETIIAYSNGRKKDGPNPRCKELRTFDPSVKPKTVVSFLAMGDVPYTLEERYCLNHQLRELKISPRAKTRPSFMIHVGDIKDGNDDVPCDYHAYNDIAKIFSHPQNALNYDPRDLFFVPGDNEWEECQYLDHSWDLWMEHFGPNNTFGFGTLSSDTKVERQTNVERLPGIDRSENFAFFKNQVLFVGLNIVGSDDMGDEDVRLVQNLDWTREQLAKYSKRRMKAAVVFAHALVNRKGAKKEYFGKGFYSLLREKYPDLPVLYLHGDWHDYCPSFPDKENPNLLDIEVDNGGKAPPILVSVIRNPNDDTHLFSVDRRGGLYSPEGTWCPKVMKRTWDLPAPPTDPSLVKFAYLGNNPSLPIGLCEGDCDKDRQCEEGLLCFERHYDEAVPGCYGATRRGQDYCYDPSWTNTTSEVIEAPTTSPALPPTLPSILPELELVSSKQPRGRCQGDCNSHADCQSGLLCFKDKDSGTVPGCAGEKNPTKEYCYAPENNNLETVARNGKPASAFPLANCHGHCETHSDCQPGLKCFRRKGFETVPGCTGKGRSFKDYCYNSTAVETKPSPPEVKTPKPSPPEVETKPSLPELRLVARKGKPASAFPLANCHGHCETDSDCQPGLKCFRRKGFEKVPGCTGKGRSYKDYCYNSTAVEAKPSPPEVETPKPSPPEVKTPKPSPPQVETPKPSVPELRLVSGKQRRGACEGDCNTHSDCERGLLCFKEKGKTIPGCSGTRIPGKEYCYAPETDILVTVARNGKPASVFPLGNCQGHCETNSDCLPGLKCHRRKGMEPVPGCQGEGRSFKDYCISSKP